MSDATSALGDPNFIRAMLNLVIPPSDRMPGAGDLELWPAVARLLGPNPAGLAMVSAGLDAIRSAALETNPGGLAAIDTGAALDLVGRVAQANPAMLPTLARLVAMVYYQQPRVLVALGEPARPPFPDGFELEPISPEWLAKLERRAQPRRA